MYYRMYNFEYTCILNCSIQNSSYIFQNDKRCIPKYTEYNFKRIKLILSENRMQNPQESFFFFFCNSPKLYYPGMNKNKYPVSVDKIE